MPFMQLYGRPLSWLLGSVCLATVISASGAAQAPKPAPAVPRDAIPAILDAFRSYRVVSFPGGRTDGSETQALLQALIRDPRFVSTVNDIVVKFGSSRYQDLMDRYVRGEDVAESDLRQVWQNAVQAGTALDNPNTPAFFRTVRELNASVPAARRIRVLLGDPPIDWDNVRVKSDYRKWEVQRDSYPADLVRREVLARNRRALIVWANGHLMRKEILTNYDMTDWQSQTIVNLIEAPGGAPVFTVRAQGSLTQWQPDAASWRPMSLTLVRGTVLGATDYGEFDETQQRYLIRGEDDFVPLPREQWVSRRLEEQVDAILYMGPGPRTSAPMSPTLCADPNYVKIRLKRIAIVGLPPGEAARVRRLCGVEK